MLDKVTQTSGYNSHFVASGTAASPLPFSSCPLVLRSSQRKMAEGIDIQLEDLQKLGFEILNADPNFRSVRRNGRTFLEGHLESMVAEVRDDVHEAMGKGRPWGTTRRRGN